MVRRAHRARHERTPRRWQSGSVTSSSAGSGGHHDVVVIGGGPAGLQAALSLGRTHRDVLLLDGGRFRNDPAAHMHNVLAHDGAAPAEFRAAGRRDLERYATVEVRSTVAEDVSPEDPGFRVTCADGTVVRTRTVLLATGLQDALPDVPGLEPLFGSAVAHCPYCHGHELAGTHVAVLGSHPHVAHQALLVERIASRLTVLADGGELPPRVRAGLERAGVAVRRERVVRVSPDGDGVRVELASGPDEHVGGLFVAPSTTQAAPFAERLGLRMLGSGCVEVDVAGRTSLPGVYAAGDMAHTTHQPSPLASVLGAAAAGQAAATGIDADLLAADHPDAAPTS